MALATSIAYATAASMLDNTFNTLINAGGGDGIINIYSGGPPADCEAVVTGNLLGTCIMNATPFIAAANQNPGAMIDENAITDDTSADTGGVAGYFRVYSTTASTDVSKVTCIIQGTVGTASTDMILDDVNIVVGGTISITDYKITMPESV
jgi:hypothetical protein